MSVEDTQAVSMLDIGSPRHWRILTMLNLGLVPEEIAATIKCSAKLARRIAEDPETPKHIETVQKLGRCMMEVNRGQFDQLQTLAINALFDVLESEKATHDQKIRAALAIFDRHPDGEFVKTAKNINQEQLEVGFSNDTMKMLKKIADKTNPKFIDITPCTSPDPLPGRSHQPGAEPQQPPAPSFASEPMEVACDVLG